VTQSLRLTNIPVHGPWILAEQESDAYYLYTSAMPSDTGDAVRVVRARDDLHGKGVVQ
jgi:hypothetical protein